MPANLQAATEAPTPEPQTNTPRSAAPPWIASATSRSRSLTPRWSNATATLMKRYVTPMQDAERWRELGQQLRVDSIRAAAVTNSGHPTSSMSGADLMAVLLDAY